MHDLYELKEMLMDELKQYGKKGEMTSGTLEVVDKLSHAIKNLCKIIESYEEEEEYSMAGGGSYRGGGRYSRRGGNSYEGGGQGGQGGGGSSYARGRQGRGRNARRDSMGRYSREGGYSYGSEQMVSELRELMEDAPDDRTRQEFERFIQKIEQM